MHDVLDEHIDLHVSGALMKIYYGTFAYILYIYRFSCHIILLKINRYIANLSFIIYDIAIAAVELTNATLAEFSTGRCVWSEVEMAMKASEAKYSL